jgi:type IX secretion system PorP/SprF family membrane protein
MMKFNKIRMKWVVAMSVIGAFSPLHAQQVALTTQYDLISSIQNPAYNGLNRILKIDALSRVQWANFPGTPRYSAVAFQSPLNKDFSLGANFQNLSIGQFKVASPMSMTSMSADIAYHKQLDKNIYAAAGLRLGVFNSSLRISQLISDAPADAAQTGNDYNFNAPLVGGGVMFYGKQYFIGASLPQFAVVPKQLVDNVNLGYNARSFWSFNAGYVYKFNKKWQVKTTAQARKYTSLPTIWDANIYGIYEGVLTLGYGYRSTGSNAFLASIRANDLIKVVFAYESGTIYDDQTPFNSIEFGISYQIDYNKEKTKVIPRQF